MDKFFDLVIVGAGPAGLAAAITARRCGLSTLVLDEQLQPGGQIYRSIEGAERGHADSLGTDYTCGEELVKEFREAGATYLPGATVWHVEKNLTISFNLGGRALQVRGKRILLTTGALERPVAIPGWTLPGVMGAGAADVLLKSAEMVPAGRVVLAGSGPLLLLVACHMVSKGVEVVGLLETTCYRDYLKATPGLPRALRRSDYLLKGLAMRRQIRQAKIPGFSGVRDLQACGEDKFEAVVFSSGGKQHKIAADTLLLHEGVIPNTHMTRMLDCEHVWNRQQRYWSPVVDRWGNTSVSGVAVAGDSVVVSGAKVAAARGHLAALETAYRLHYLTMEQRNFAARSYQQCCLEESLVRPLLDRLFVPNPETIVPPRDETLVCRCEEISAGQVRQSVAVGNHSPGAVKVHLRTGMGPCQGRMCGLTIAEIIADCRNVDVPQVESFNIRPPVKPVTLGQLAGIELSA